MFCSTWPGVKAWLSLTGDCSYIWAIVLMYFYESGWEKVIKETNEDKKDEQVSVMESLENDTNEE